MSEIIKIGLTKNHNQEIIEVTAVDLVAGKGIVGDRHFKDFNDPFNQLSVIESENIDQYNFKNKLNPILGLFKYENILYQFIFFCNFINFFDYNVFCRYTPP